MTNRLIVRTGALALVVAIAAAPLAAESSAPVARASLRAQSLAVAPSARMLRQTKPTETTAQEPPRTFWRSRRGVAVAAMMVAITGYVVYSRSHDRVKSPAS